MLANIVIFFHNQPAIMANLRCVTCFIVSTINSLFLLAFLFLLLFPCISYFIYICFAYIYILLNSLFYLYTVFKCSKCTAWVSVFILRLRFYIFNNYSILAVFSYCWKPSYLLAWKMGLGGSLRLPDGNQTEAARGDW